MSLMCRTGAEKASNDISTLGRITSGVKMMDLEDGIKIAKIAKVREKISNGEQEFDNLEDAIESVEEEIQDEGMQDQGLL